ncbi:MAG: hypothetical protein ACWGON_10270 [Gemmatimonadota bacterium]
MKVTRFLFLPLLLMFAIPVQAQEPEMEWLTVFSDHVSISNRSDYEDLIQDFVAMFDDADISSVSWVTIQSQPFGYAYVIQGMGPADMPAMNEMWGSAMAELGDGAMKLANRANALVDNQEMSYIALRPELSYMPDEVAITADMPYRHYTRLFVHPAKGEAFEASMPAWIGAYEEAGVKYGWRTYQMMTGSDLPAYLIVQAAKSEAEFYQHRTEIQSILGDKLNELRGKTGPTLRRVEESGAWVRPELSYSGGN